MEAKRAWWRPKNRRSEHFDTVKTRALFREVIQKIMQKLGCTNPTVLDAQLKQATDIAQRISYITSIQCDRRRLINK